MKLNVSEKTIKNTFRKETGLTLNILNFEHFKSFLIKSILEYITSNIDYEDFSKNKKLYQEVFGQIQPTVWDFLVSPSYLDINPSFLVKIIQSKEFKSMVRISKRDININKRTKFNALKIFLYREVMKEFSKLFEENYNKNHNFYDSSVFHTMKVNKLYLHTMVTNIGEKTPSFVRAENLDISEFIDSGDIPSLKPELQEALFKFIDEDPYRFYYIKNNALELRKVQEKLKELVVLALDRVN